MKWHWKRELLPLAMLAAVILVTLFFYPRLPETIPTHYGFNGKADDFSSKGPFVLLYASMSLGVYLLMTFVPFIDPFRKKFGEKYSTFLIIRDCALFFFLLFYVIILMSAQSGKLNGAAFGAGLGLFFVLMGNYLPRLPRNFFFGIRSPWTLASEEVWKRTHVIGGYLFVIAGLLMAVLSLAGVDIPIALAGVMVPLILFVGLIYPFFLYRKLQKENKIETPQM